MRQAVLSKYPRDQNLISDIFKLDSLHCVARMAIMACNLPSLNNPEDMFLIAR
jgi:hypothetical protein